MKLLTAAEILAKDDSQVEDVVVPEWGGTVRLRSLSGEERDRFDKASVRVTGKGKAETREVVIEGLKARLVAMSAVDDAGNRIFTDAQVAALGKKNAAVLDRLFVVAQRLSGLTNADVEELAGESEAAPPSSSSTD